MSKIKAILFDYDGTLRDTRELIYTSIDHAFETHGLDKPTKKQLEPYIHHHTAVHKGLASTVPLETFEAKYKQKADDLRPSTQLYDFSKETLTQLRELGYQLALVTAAFSVYEDVKRLEVADYWDVIVGASDVKNHKPDPEGILLALSKLGVKAADTVYVGDLPTDMAAAQAAGLGYTIGITHGFASQQALEKAGANAIVHSLPEIIPLVQTWSSDQRDA